MKLTKKQKQDIKIIISDGLFYYRSYLPDVETAPEIHVNEYDHTVSGSIARDIQALLEGELTLVHKDLNTERK